jgi:hypothetical protein
MGFRPSNFSCVSPLAIAAQKIAAKEFITTTDVIFI